MESFRVEEDRRWQKQDTQRERKGSEREKISVRFFDQSVCPIEKPNIPLCYS